MIFGVGSSSPYHETTMNNVICSNLLIYFTPSQGESEETIEKRSPQNILLRVLQNCQPRWVRRNNRKKKNLQLWRINLSNYTLMMSVIKRQNVDIMGKLMLLG